MFERKNYALQVALKKYHKENHTLPERVWCIRYKLLLLFVVNYSTRIGTGGGGGGGGGLYYSHEQQHEGAFQYSRNEWAIPGVYVEHFIYVALLRTASFVSFQCREDSSDNVMLGFAVEVSFL